MFSSYQWKESVFPKMSYYSVNMFYELAQGFITYQIHAFHKSDNDALTATTTSAETVNVLTAQFQVHREAFQLKVTCSQTYWKPAAFPSMHQQSCQLCSSVNFSWRNQHFFFFFFYNCFIQLFFFHKSLNSLIIIPCNHLLHTTQFERL